MRAVYDPPLGEGENRSRESPPPRWTFTHRVSGETRREEGERCSVVEAIRRSSRRDTGFPVKRDGSRRRPNVGDPIGGSRWSLSGRSASVKPLHSDAHTAFPVKSEHPSPESGPVESCELPFQMEELYVVNSFLQKDFCFPSECLGRRYDFFELRFIRV